MSVREKFTCGDLVNTIRCPHSSPSKPTPQGATIESNVWGGKYPYLIHGWLYADDELTPASTPTKLILCL